MNDDAVVFSRPQACVDGLAHSHEVRCIELDFDPGASFMVPVPRSMVTARPSRHVPQAPGRPMPLAVFGFPPRLHGPRLSVSTQTLRWEVDPLEWLRWLVVRQGWRVAEVRRHPGRNGPRCELGALREVDGRVEVRRTMALRSGARLVRCDAWSPRKDWPAHHDALWHALDGFRLGQHRRGSVEPLVAHEGPLLGFAVPGSWDARGVGDARRMEWGAQLTENPQRGAVLRIRARLQDPAADARERRDSLWRSLKRDGHRIGAVFDAARPELAAGVPGWIGQWQAALGTDGRDGVVVLVQREHHGIAVDYVLIAPTAGTEHVDWMRATRALDVAVATSRLGPPAT